MRLEGNIRMVVYMARYHGDDIARDLVDIARVSVRNNARDGVTGALVYDHGYFIQVLEGGSHGVTGVLLRVMEDTRARDITVLVDRWNHHRTMADWSMFTLRVDSSTGADPFGMAAFRKAYRNVQKGDVAAFVQSMRTVLQGHEGQSPAGVVFDPASADMSVLDSVRL